MNTVIKTMWYFFLVCLALSLIAGCTAEGELSTSQLEINLPGKAGEFPVDGQGKLKTKVEIASADGRIGFSLNEGTLILDKDEKPLQVIDVAIDPSPPPPPADAYIVGPVYDLEPEGANFNPQIKLTFSYDPGELPEGVTERNLYIACYQDNEWKMLVYKKVDTESRIRH